MTKLNRLFPRKDSYAGTSEKNRAGGKAFSHSIYEQAVQTLMVGNLEGTFYASARELARESLDVLEAIANKDPLFLAQALVFARNDGYLRIAPIVGLLVLSKKDPVLFRRVFDSVIKQPGDLQDFLTLVRGGSIRGMGASIRKAAGSWLMRISPYHVIKYGAPQKKPGTGTPLNLRDILRVVRPVPPNPAVDRLWKYIILRIRGERISQSLLKGLPEQVRAYEKFKDLTGGSGSVDEAKALKLVQESRLPYEVVTSRLSTPGTWKVLANDAPFMNMLRNLNNYEKNGVFKDRQVLRKVVGRLTDKEQIRKSKQFPFRFYSAYRYFSGNPEVRDALVDAIDLSVGNVPDLGRVLVAVDGSGSMNSLISAKSNLSIRDIANIFAGAFYRKSQGGYLVPFTTVAYPVGMSETEFRRNKDLHAGHYGLGYGHMVETSYNAIKRVNRRDSVVTIAEALSGVNGGTSLSAPLDWALNEDREFDTAVFITDNESWADHLRGNGGVLDRIRKYRRRNPRAQFFFLQLTGERNLQTPEKEPGVHYVYGWSDNVLRYIGQAAAGEGSQVEAVKSISLPVPKAAERPRVARKVVQEARSTRKVKWTAKKAVRPRRKARLK